MADHTDREGRTAAHQGGSSGTPQCRVRYTLTRAIALRKQAKHVEAVEILDEGLTMSREMSGERQPYDARPAAPPDILAGMREYDPETFDTSCFSIRHVLDRKLADSHSNASEGMLQEVLAAMREVLGERDSETLETMIRLGKMLCDDRVRNKKDTAEAVL